MPPRQARRGGAYLPISISSSPDSSPPSTPAPLPTPSFEVTPSGSSFESDPSEDSHEYIPLQTPMPMSPDPYYTDIEVDVVHDHPAEHPAAHAAAAEDVPHVHAEAPPAAQPAPAPAPTDPAIVALLELMAEMVNLQHQTLNAQHAPRAPQAGSSRSPLPFPIPPAKRQAISGRAYALELPGPPGPPKGPITD
ncbi:hypothetical protein IGI04_024115 [Brassica rapa subsp. trilocularis]|uniref:Uncharacterized protein n=1 Tax=Brassica rapa subsp. trilocularis TaxID=1813537 RepID=A0ABQ7M6D5_BRACM|nr:hypothetical protein IGI04_024115 [Brassica rapa subsp. trilocularis]